MPKLVRARPPLDDSESRKIRRLAGAWHAPADWSGRAGIVTLSWDGLAVAAIAAEIGCHHKHGARLAAPVQRGRSRLGSVRRRGAGRKRWITEAQRSAIIALAGSLPPGRFDRDAAGELSADDEPGPAQPTLDTLAQAARDAGSQVRRSQVRRILLAKKVCWRRTRSPATSTDPTVRPKGPASWSSIPLRRRARR